MHDTVTVPDPLYFHELEIARFARQAEGIISLAKVKLVNICGVSLSLKNIKGVMPPRMKRAFHCEGLNQGIVDLCKVVKPGLSIIDGTYSMDQVKMKHRSLGLFVASTDPVAADAVCTKIMGFEPTEIEHIALASQAGLGTCDLTQIEVVGKALEGLVGKYSFSKPANPFQLIRQYVLPVEIIQGAPCSSCLNQLGNDLLEVVATGALQGKIRILVGPQAVAPDAEAGEINIYYGNCLARRKAGGIFVHGCPPDLSFLGTGSLKEALDSTPRPV